MQSMRIGLPQEGLVCYKRSWIKGMKKKAEPPTTLVEFSQMFPNERACWDYLFAVRWPEGFICPRCGEHGGYIIEGRRVVECSAAKCRYHCSLTAGTVLHRTKQSLLSWFWAVYLVTSMTPGISAQQLQRQAGIRAYETAFCMLHKIRSALVVPGRDRLQGEVELDECYVGGKEEGRTGRGAEKKQIVIGGVELVRWQEPKSGRLRVRCGRIRLEVAPDESGRTLKKFAHSHIARGATVLTDGWRGYSFLPRTGYKHVIVDAEERDQNLPHFHRVVSNLKTWLMGTYHGGVQAKHLQAYLDEFTFRFNRRFMKGGAFDRALGLSMGTSAPTYEDLYAKIS